MAILFLIVLLTGETPAWARPSHRCAAGLSATGARAFIDHGRQRIPVPIGVPATVFSDWLDDLAGMAPRVEAVVIFGSRTHFSHLYAPTPRSDLDVFAFLDEVSPLPVLPPWNRFLAFPVSIAYPKWKFDQAITQREFLFPRSMEEERGLFAAVERPPFLWRWILPYDVRSAYQDNLYAKNPFITAEERNETECGRFELAPRRRFLCINKEALFLLNGGPGVDQTIESLTRQGFVNVFRLDQ